MKCECGTEFNGKFCPNCGKPAGKEEFQSGGKKKRTWLLIPLVVLIAAAAFVFFRINLDNSNIDDIKAKFDGTITENYLPGTYVSKDGELFAVQIGSTTSANEGHVIIPDTGWLEETAQFNADRTTITVSDTTYSCKLDKDTITLIAENGVSTEFEKISDEYDAAQTIDPERISAEAISGNYASANIPLKPVIMANIEKSSDDTVDICVFSYDTNRGNAVIVMGLAEDVPCSAFAGNSHVYIKGANNAETYYISFEDRGQLAIETTENVTKAHAEEYELNIDQNIEEYKLENHSVDYNYASFGDIISLQSNINEFFSFHQKWYEYMFEFQDVELKSDGDTVHIYIKGIPLYTFNKADYVAGRPDDSNTSAFVAYECENEVELRFYPKYSSDIRNANDETKPLIRLIIDNYQGNESAAYLDGVSLTYSGEANSQGSTFAPSSALPSEQSNNITKMHDDYILPNSNTQELSESDLQGLSKEQVTIAKNEIYARHGREFKTEWLQEYFDSCSWYSINSNYNYDNEESMLNEIELHNVRVIAEYENSIK